MLKQLGFASLAIQAGVDPMTPFPDENGTFPVSYFTIIGEFDYIMPVCNIVPTA